ncbi:MAG: hypothetical protein F6K19_15365 [Cyanothece sp. SIO1E1]|nr:hypothetical protein [Cyanothece sp. SIO1E1]
MLNSDQPNFDIYWQADSSDEPVKVGECFYDTCFPVKLPKRGTYYTIPK